MMEEVPTDGVEDHLVHYVPTGPVWREDKPTKLRVVVDASARADRGSRCLNDCLHPGPSLLENLVGIQLRSRLHPILLLGDVEKAFLQLSLAEEDRDVTRVLWLKDYKKPPTPDNIRELRYKRVPFGISSSPFLLFATIRHHLEASGSQYADEYARNMYSDNLFLFADSQTEALEKYTETKKIFTEMKMNIREFLSNDSSVMQQIPEADRAKETKEKTLGLAWSPSGGAADYWELKLPNPRVVVAQPQGNTDGTETKKVPKKKRRDKYTRRFLISVTNKLFDPKGMACPLTLQARLTYQDTWEDQSKKWDEELSEDLIQKWIRATETWIDAPVIKIPRYLFQGIQKPFEVEMHIFTDASKDACGAAYYLLARDAGGRTACRLIFGKNYVRKNKPKPLTIPRLELTAVLIGCRCLRLLRT
ncbi:Pao retrotransposon peptidase family protein [Aphelenchoides avenae]|nr:Pao retrotransposon peptidase family protein [Aphelenchus avenae]